MGFSYLLFEKGLNLSLFDVGIILEFFEISIGLSITPKTKVEFPSPDFAMNNVWNLKQIT